MELILSAVGAILVSVLMLLVGVLQLHICDSTRLPAWVERWAERVDVYTGPNPRPKNDLAFLGIFVSGWVMTGVGAVMTAVVGVLIVSGLAWRLIIAIGRLL